MLKSVIESANEFKRIFNEQGKYTLTAPRSAINFIGTQNVIKELERNNYKVEVEHGINITNIYIGWNII